MNYKNIIIFESIYKNGKKVIKFGDIGVQKQNISPA